MVRNSVSREWVNLVGSATKGAVESIAFCAADWFRRDDGETCNDPHPAMGRQQCESRLDFPKIAPHLHRCLLMGDFLPALSMGGVNPI